VHNPAARGPISAPTWSINPRDYAFEVDEAGEGVFDYGRSTMPNLGGPYRKRVFFRHHTASSKTRASKQGFFDGLMAKYGKQDSGRPKPLLPAARRDHALPPSPPSASPARRRPFLLPRSSVARQGSLPKIKLTARPY